MKLIKINPKRFSPKHIFGYKTERSSLNQSDPLSFGSTSSSSSSLDSSSSVHKPRIGSYSADFPTPTSILPYTSGDWSEISSDTNLDQIRAFKPKDGAYTGIVSRKELELLLSRIGAEPPSEEEVTMMLSEVDRNGDGCINLYSLMSRVGSACGPACDDEMREAFEFFDADHDGKITAQELLSVFAAIGDERCTLEDCRRMIGSVDKNGDGFVCFEEFLRMMDGPRD